MSDFQSSLRPLEIPVERLEVGPPGGLSWDGFASSVCKHACSAASVVSDSAMPGTVARQVPLSMGFSRQEYWSHALLQGIFPTQGRVSCMAGGFFAS